MRKAAIALITVMAGLSFACGSSDSAPTGSSAPAPTPTPVPYDGSWSGSTGKAQPVTFTVQGGRVTQFSIGLPFRYESLGVECIKTLEGAPAASIDSGAFSFTLSSQGMSSVISGSFSSPTQASGSYGTTTLTNFTCGPLSMEGGSYMSTPQTFTATKR